MSFKLTPAWARKVRKSFAPGVKVVPDKTKYQRNRSLCHHECIRCEDQNCSARIDY